MTLGDILADEASDLPGIESSSGGDGATTWSRGGRPFAALSIDGATAEFALDPAVAAAALRTPGATASSRGSGWVTFAPAALDDHAVDRARAWFASAHRRLGPRD